MLQQIAVEFRRTDHQGFKNLPGEMRDKLAQATGADVTMKSKDRPDGSTVYVLSANLEPGQRAAFDAVYRELGANLAKVCGTVGAVPVIEPEPLVDLDTIDPHLSRRQHRHHRASLPYQQHTRNLACDAARVAASAAQKLIEELGLAPKKGAAK